MSIFTPRGLKLRLPVNYSFALMGRVYPQTSAFEILRCTEDFENMAGFVAFATANVAFILKLEPLLIFYLVFAGSVIVNSARLWSFIIYFPFTLLLPFMKVYSYVSGYGILFIEVTLLGYFCTGWWGIAAFLGGRILAGMLSYVREFIKFRAFFLETKIAISSSELNFFHAYQLAARRQGVTTSLEISEAEIESESGQKSFAQLAQEWPEIVKRFTPDDKS